jgi:regulatory protein
MSWRLRRVEDRWEIWKEDELHEECSLPFLPSRSRTWPCLATYEELKKWLQEEERKLAKKKALNLLARRSQPSQILRCKLKMAGFSDRVSQETVEWAQQLGYVQDCEYMQSLIRQERDRGHGPKAILWKLRAKGFSQEAIEKELRETLPGSRQTETIRKVMSKLRLNPTDRQKTIISLLRRGFDIELIHEVLKTQPTREIGEMQ